MTIFEQVQDIIAATLNIDKTAVTENLSAGDIEEWDSMGNMAIIAAIEEQMDVEFPIEDLFDLNSVKSLVEAVEKLK